MRAIDALQLPEVLNGLKWVAYVEIDGRKIPPMIQQTFRVFNNDTCWCDTPSQAGFTFRRLHEVVLVDPKYFL